MTEDEAKAWVRDRVSEDQHTLLNHYVELLIEGTESQNLIAPSTVSSIWSRHIVDSLQLVCFAPAESTRWLDIGSGAGLPGIVVAIAGRCHVTLSEPRNLRVAFLSHCIERLDIGQQVEVASCKAQLMDAPAFDVISARAVASCAGLLEMSKHLANSHTTYVLPKGASADEDVYNARKTWAGAFHVERSVVDPLSGIVVANGVRRK
ncbi:16S rRNA (guanine(527)-N(7))-methyltransferase RsmG [Sphingomonas sp. RS2018]